LHDFYFSDTFLSYFFITFLRSDEMPEFAKRMGTVNPSVIVQIATKARELKAAGHDIISFSIGVPNFLPAKHIYDAAHEAIDNDAGNYLPCRGTDELVNAFVERLKKDGFDYKPSEICASLGAKNSLFNLAFCMLDEGDEVILPTPFWSSYEDMMDMTGAKMVNIRCGSDQDYKMTPEQLEAAITPKTKMLIFNNPSNPTGMVYTKEEIKALGDILEKHDIWIVSDDIYDKMIFDGMQFAHLLHTNPALKPRTVIVQSISKTYGMPGWRVGMTASTEEIAQKLITMNANTTMSVPGVAMAAAAAAFSGDHDFVYKERDKFQVKRDIVMEALDSIEGVVCPFPRGAFYAFPDVSAYFGKSYKGETITDDVKLAEMLLEHALVALVPGGAFGEPNAIRISYACPDDELKEGMERLKTFFSACEGKGRLSA
jgi:aspartate aminotransferase